MCKRYSYFMKIPCNSRNKLEDLRLIEIAYFDATPWEIG